MVTFSVTMGQNDGPAQLALAHTALDLIGDLLADAPVTSGLAPGDVAVGPLVASMAGTMAGGAIPSDDRHQMNTEELRTFLTARATQGRSPLNAGERLMLGAIAGHAPAPFPYEENNLLLGGGKKFGNVSSGLARRFWFRGVELPYRPAQDETGYVMDAEEAAVVLEVLAATEPPQG